MVEGFDTSLSLYIQLLRRLMVFDDAHPSSRWMAAVALGVGSCKKLKMTLSGARDDDWV